MNSNYRAGNYVDMQSFGCNKHHWENQFGNPHCFGPNPCYNPCFEHPCPPQNQCGDLEIRIPRCAVYFLAGYLFSKTIR